MLQLGLDLGGTKIEGVVLDPIGKVLFRERIATEQASGYEPILNNLQILYQTMCREIKGQEHTLGLGTPGSISSKSGFLKNSNTVCLNGKLTLPKLKELFQNP